MNKYLNKGKITPEEYLMNEYVDEVYEFEYVRTYTTWLLTNVDTKYEKSESNKVTKINAST